MIRRRTELLVFGLIGTSALAFGPVREARADVGVTGTVTVQPVSDPIGFYNGSLKFIPDTSIGEYFAPNPPFPAAPTDYFTITGFGTLIGINSLSLTNFNYDAGRSTATTLWFDYRGTTDLLGSGSPPTADIGTISFDATDISTHLTIAYFDHRGYPNTPAPNSGTNQINVSLVPEPAALILLGLGSIGGLAFRRRLSSRRPA